MSSLLQGLWRTVASRTSLYASQDAGSRQRLEAAAWHALALTKLQQYQKAWDVLTETAAVNNPGHLAEGGPRSGSAC